MEELYLDDDLFIDDGGGFFAEAKAFERVSMVGKLSEYITPIGTDRKGREIYSPEDQFLINVDTFCRKMSNEGVFKFTQLDIDNLLKTAKEKVLGLRFKNYVGFVLGYVASEGGRNLKVEKVKMVLNTILPKIKEGGVEPPDVVRYARFWKENL